MIGHLHVLSARTEQDDFADLLRQLVPGRGQHEIVVVGEALQGLAVILGRRIGPGRERALVQRQGLVWNHEVWVEVHLRAQTVTSWAGPKGIVEGEQARFDLIDGEPRYGTGKLHREDGAAFRHVVLDAALLRRFGRRWRIRVVHIGQAVGKCQGGLEAVSQARLDAFAHHDAVDHHFDFVLVLFIKRRGLFDVEHLAVNAQALETALCKALDFLLELTFLAARDRCQ